MADGDTSFKQPEAEPQPLYTAAANGRRMRVWRVPMSGPNSVTLHGLGTIRARARAAVRNDTWAGAAQEKLIANAIGTGIQAKALWGSEEHRLHVKRLWRDWTAVADADGVLNFDALQALIFSEWVEAGEVFIRLRPRLASDGLPVPLQIQVIEAEQCPADYYASHNGNDIRAGIEFDLIGRRVAYWMYRAHPGDYHSIRVGGGELVRVPAENILHVYRPLRAGQIRGIPTAASALVRMFNLDTFDDAVLERMKSGNLFAGFYTTETDGENEGQMIPGMQTETDVDDTPLAGLEPGTMQELPAGVKPVFTDPPDPGSNHETFVRGQLMAIFARYGVPYEVGTGDLRNVSDRALKLILNEFRRLIEMLQWLYLIPQALQPIRGMWFDQAVIAGKLVVPGYMDIRTDVTDTLWVPQGWPYSHPVQDVEADIKAIRGGLTTLSRTHLGTGEDPDDIFQGLAADNARIDALGLTLDSDPRKSASAGPAQARAAGTEPPNTDNDNKD